jgi:hypothetical protein
MVKQSITKTDSGFVVLTNDELFWVNGGTDNISGDITVSISQSTEGKTDTAAIRADGTMDGEGHSSFGISVQLSHTVNARGTQGTVYVSTGETVQTSGSVTPAVSAGAKFTFGNGSGSSGGGPSGGGK